MTYNKENYKNFLKNRIDKLNENCEYNIFCHKICISPSENKIKDKTQMQIVLEKMDSILNSKGLALDNSEYYRGLFYGSINATAKFIEGGKEIDVENVLNYDYPPHSSCVATVVIAIPKYVKLDGKEVEFSSTNGHSEIQNIDELNNYFKQNRATTDRQHAKTTIYDALRSGFSIENKMILGAQVLDKQTNTYKFIENENHISHNQGRFDCYVEKIKERLISSINFHGATSTKELLVKTTKMHERYNDDFYNEP